MRGWSLGRGLEWEDDARSLFSTSKTARINVCDFCQWCISRHKQNPHIKTACCLTTTSCQQQSDIIQKLCKRFYALLVLDCSCAFKITIILMIIITQPRSLTIVSDSPRNNHPLITLEIGSNVDNTALVNPPTSFAPTANILKASTMENTAQINI